MDKKKVLFISAANSIHTVKWVNALAESFELHLVYCKNHKPTINKIDSRVKLHELKFNAPFGYYFNSFELKRIARKINPDVINVHYASGYGTLARVAKLKNILLSVWGSDVYDFPSESKLKKIIIKKNVMYAKEIASTSYAMAKQLKKVVPELDKNIHITPFGVDIDKFKKINEYKTRNEIIIGNVKTLDNEIYGINYAILAIKKLKEDLIIQGKSDLLNRVKFYMYGEGKDREKLQEIIDNNNLKDTFFLKGKIPNETVPKVLNEFDIFCITSNKESFGVSVIEAMACEVPVVATDTDGFKEVMEDGKTGLIVPRKNVEEIANAIEKILFDDDIRFNMGKQGRKKVIEEYNWANNVDMMINVYNSMIAGK